MIEMHEFSFQIYINYVNLIVNLFIPTIVLGVLNCLVYQALKKSTSLSTQLRRSGRGEEAMRKRDIRLTRIAIVIVGVFLACHLPRFIPNIVEMLFGLPEVTIKYSFFDMNMYYIRFINIAKLFYTL